VVVVDPQHVPLLGHAHLVHHVAEDLVHLPRASMRQSVSHAACLTRTAWLASRMCVRARVCCADLDVVPPPALLAPLVPGGLGVRLLVLPMSTAEPSAYGRV
jgi:hypothetical protein